MGQEIHLLPGIGAFAGHVAGLAAVVAGGVAPASAKAAAAVLGQRRQWATSVRCFGKAQGTCDIRVGEWAMCLDGVSGANGPWLQQPSRVRSASLGPDLPK